MTAPGLGSAAFFDGGNLLPQIRDEPPHRRRIRGEHLRAPVEQGRENRHRWPAPYYLGRIGQAESANPWDRCKGVRLPLIAVPSRSASCRRLLKTKQGR